MQTVHKKPKQIKTKLEVTSMPAEKTSSGYEISQEYLLEYLSCK